MSGFVLNYANVKSWAERLFGKQFRCNDEVEQLGLPHVLLDAQVWLVFIVRAERNMLTLALTLPMVVPRERFAEMGQALTLLNARSYMGAWILNVDNGEVSFRITVPTLEVNYTDQGLRFVAAIVAWTAESVAHLLRAIACEGAAAESVAAAISRTTAI